MAVTYPYSVAFLADTLRIKSAITDIQRNDEYSGTGDGRIFQAELAPPLWMLTIGLALDEHDKIKQAAAKIRKLHGSQESFLMYDTLSQYPQNDPKGLVLGSSTVVGVMNAANRSVIGVSGLPASYKLTVGDKFTLIDGANPTKIHYHEFSETLTATSGGVISSIHVFPRISVNLAGNIPMTLKKPYGRFIILPNSFNPGTAEGLYTQGAGFKAVQRK